MKYTLNYVKELFKNYGYYLDVDIYNNTKEKMPCHDKDGFKYMLCVDDVKTNRHPYKFHKSNIFTINNIQKILDEETDGVKILSKIYNNTKEQLKFVCSCGKNFSMPLNQFVSDGKRYCNYCSKSKRYNNIFDYYSLVKDKCDELNYELCTKEIKRSNQSFNYICNKHKDNGIQTSTYDRMINKGQGCYYCGIEKRGLKHRVKLDDVITELNQKGFDYVDHYYDKLSVKGSSKIRIGCICRKHREKGKQYLDYWNLKTNKIGCYYCKGYGRTKESLQKEFDDIKNDITIIEFNKYSDITVECNLCKRQWRARGIDILLGSRCHCRSCSNYEKITKEIFDKNNIKYEMQYRFNDCKDRYLLPFDFYLYELNTVVEVDGQQHYYAVNFGGISDEKALENYNITKKHDKIKNDYCNNNGIHIIRIPFFIFNDKNIDIEKYILDKI